MKQSLSIVLAIGLVTSLYTAKGGNIAPADTLYLRTREKQAVEIKEVYPDQIKYQRVGSKVSAVQTVSLSAVAYIVYTNGTKDVFNEFVALKPEISWVTPTTHTDQEELLLKACVLNKAQQIQVELNGSVVMADSRSFIPADKFCNEGDSFSQRIRLQVGENKVVLIATNEVGVTRSAPLTLWYDRPEKRLALVIGNANYAAGNKLANPVNDASDVSDALKKLGFEVMSFTNLTRQTMREAINEFGQRLQGNKYQVGLFYYAGHGVQYQDRNFLVPVDAQPKSVGDIEFECEQADRVLRKMADARVATNIVVLDACRNNPFDRSFSRGGDDQGLSMMRAPNGTFIAFSTAPDQTAADGGGRNGVFTGAFLQALSTPNLTIESVFKRVRNEVMIKTNNKQTPWDQSSLTGEDFYFLKK